MIELFLAAFVTFFVVVDPPGVAPMFATLTGHTSRAWQQKMAFKSVGVAALVLLGFAFGGHWLLDKLQVSLDSFRIAGGILLFLIAVDMLFEKQAERREARNEKVMAEAAQHPERFEDVSVFPLAIPLISGPGAIATVMLYFSEQSGVEARFAVMAAVALNLALCLGVFLVAGPLTRMMGQTIATMISRIFGIILAALAAQFVVDGLSSTFHL